MHCSKFMASLLTEGDCCDLLNIEGEVPDFGLVHCCTVFRLASFAVGCILCI